MTYKEEMKFIATQIVKSKGHHVYLNWSKKKKDVHDLVSSLNEKINQKPIIEKKFIDLFENHCFDCDFFRCKKDFTNKIYSASCSHIDSKIDSQGNSSFLNCPLKALQQQTFKF